MLRQTRSSKKASILTCPKKDDVLGLKSPVFRDRTNMASRKNAFGLKKVVEEPKEKENAKKKVEESAAKKPVIRPVRVKKAPPRDSSFKLEEKPKTRKTSFVPTTKALRPKSLKNYCDDSNVKENCDENTKKDPVYKTVDKDEKDEDKEKVYDFFVDDNSPGTQAVKSKKKRIVKKKEKKENVPKVKKVPKPKKTACVIKSVEKLEGSKKVVLPDKMVNHSLLRESLSPIKKVDDSLNMSNSNNLTQEMFSKVKKVVQSTPQITKVPSTREKKTKTEALMKKPLTSSPKIEVETNKNQIFNETTISNISYQQELPKSPRKFGTVLSNDMSPRSISTNSSKNSSNSRTSTLASESQAVMTAVKSLSKSPVEEQISSIMRAVENKENLKPHPSPEKNSQIVFKQHPLTPKRRLSLRLLPKSPKKTQSPKKPQTIFPKQSDFREGSFQPEPGPSSSTLRQSNLDSFFELDKSNRSAKPQTKSIALFDEPKQTETTESEKFGVENAFGFDDTDVDDEPPMPRSAHNSSSLIATVRDVKESKKGKVFLNARVKSSAKIPARVSAGEVKRVLRKKAEPKPEINESVKKILPFDSDDDDNEFVKKSEKNNNLKKPVMKTPKEVMLDAISFSDTFDLQKPDEWQVPENDVPLFIDLEPVHFNKPPRRSYVKRKRIHFCEINRNEKSELESSEDDEICEKRVRKKKRPSKKVTEEQKKMEEWIKNTNNTFEEIDNFDLIVE